MIGDTVKQGDLIGTSGSNKVESSSENMLLFEVENNGTYINPEKFYEMKLEELS
jgi:murein DD-endopeptidase MepM/ murein hydrolase activator NlpD